MKKKIGLLLNNDLNVINNEHTIIAVVIII